MIYKFHTSVHARAADLGEGPIVNLEGAGYRTLAVLPCHMQYPFAGTFEEAVAALELLPRMFCEPDGSFVWVGNHEGQHWQVDGNLLDRHGRLLFVELRGQCPAAPFDQLLAALGWPATPVMFQMTRAAVFLGETEFRAAASFAGQPGQR